jgi:hypothetical protein
MAHLHTFSALFFVVTATQKAPLNEFAATGLISECQLAVQVVRQLQHVTRIPGHAVFHTCQFQKLIMLRSSADMFLQQSTWVVQPAVQGFQRKPTIACSANDANLQLPLWQSANPLTGYPERIPLEEA